MKNHGLIGPLDVFREDPPIRNTSVKMGNSEVAVFSIVNKLNDQHYATTTKK